MINMDKTIVYIDGGYMLKMGDSIGQRIDIAGLARNLAASQGLQIKKAYYYGAEPFMDRVPTEDQELRMQRHRKFMKFMEKAAPECIMRMGRIQKIGNTYKQKGVDTLIALDMLEEAMNDYTINSKLD